MRQTIVFKEEILSTKISLVRTLCFATGSAVRAYIYIYSTDYNMSPKCYILFVINLICKSDTALFSRHQMWNETIKEMVNSSAVESIDDNNF